MDRQKLIQIILDQAQQKLPKTIVPRWQYEHVVPLVSNKQIIIISGIRRCGKSTLMQLIRHNNIEKDYYINFDDDRLIPFTLEDFQVLIEAFIELYDVQNTFYFDEIQLVPGWERFVRRLHNEGKKVFITGSNANLLSHELGTHLTGRHITVKLFPYSFKEFIKYIDPNILEKDNLSFIDTALVKKYFSEFSIFGGMPEYLEYRQKQYLHALYESIIYKDIIVRNKIPQEKPIKELVYYFASNNAKEFSYNSVRKILNIASANTIADYCQYLENSFLCFSLTRFSYSLKEQINYAKKIYFIDQALAESVGFRFSEDQGRTLENIVFLQLLRQDKDVYFYKKIKECDFIIRDGYEITSAIQVCTSLDNPTTKKREITGLIAAMIEYKLSYGLIITHDECGTEEHMHDNIKYNIKIIPCWRWLLDTEN